MRYNRKTTKIAGPVLLEETIIKEKDMFLRHAVPFTSIIIIIRDVVSNPLEPEEKFLINETFDYFNSEFGTSRS